MKLFLYGPIESFNKFSGSHFLFDEEWQLPKVLEIRHLQGTPKPIQEKGECQRLHSRDKVRSEEVLKKY